MKKITLLLFLLLIVSFVKGQELNTQKITNWSTLRKSGFFESNVENAQNAPGNANWYWGINIGHSSNATNSSYYYNGQIAIPVSTDNTKSPTMFFRSTDISGKGIWARVLHNQGAQTINGNLYLATTHNGGLRIGGKDAGNVSVPVGGVATQLNIDFPGYRDIEPNFVGARISCLRFNIHQDNKALMQNAGLAFYTSPYAGPSLVERMRITPNGNIGIGTANPGATLDVNGSIRASTLNVAGEVNARAVNITINAGADFVFEPDYALKPLSELEAFVKENKHLPEIPSEKQMVEEGLNVNEMQIKLLQKVEELTLYVIDQDKRIKALEEENKQLKIQQP